MSGKRRFREDWTMLTRIAKKFNICSDYDASEVGFFLANSNDATALILLETLFFSVKDRIIYKKLDVNKQFMVKGQDFTGVASLHSETIASSLVNNPLYISRDTLLNISKMTCVDYSFKPFGDDSFPLYEQLVRIIYDITDKKSRFYMRNDLVIKNLQLLKFLVERGIVPITGKDYYFENIDMVIRKAKEMNLSAEVLNLFDKILAAGDNPSLESYHNFVNRMTADDIRKHTRDRLNDSICHDEATYMDEIVIPFMKSKKKQHY